jgi:hypothetical protein
MAAWKADGFSDNPLADYVEIPAQYSGLSYCNLLCGVVRGAMECASWRVTCTWERDPLAPPPPGSAGGRAAGGTPGGQGTVTPGPDAGGHRSNAGSTAAITFQTLNLLGAQT